MLSFYLVKKIFSNLEAKVKYLHTTDEREASEEPHGSSYSWQLVYKLGCSVLQCLYVVIIIIIDNMNTFWILSKVEVENDICKNFSLLVNFRSKKMLSQLFSHNVMNKPSIPLGKVRFSDCWFLNFSYWEIYLARPSSFLTLPSLSTPMMEPWQFSRQAPSGPVTPATQSSALGEHTEASAP